MVARVWARNESPGFLAQFLASSERGAEPADLGWSLIAQVQQFLIEMVDGGRRIFLVALERLVLHGRNTGIVQRAAMAAWEGKGGFRDLLLAEPGVADALAARDLDAAIDPARFVDGAGPVFERLEALR